MTTREEIIREAEAILEEKRCGGGIKDKEKERSRRKTALPSGPKSSLKVNDPQFILNRLESGQNAGIFSRGPKIAQIGEQQILMAENGPSIAYGIVQRGGPICSTDLAQFVENVEDSVCLANRMEFEETEKFYFIPLTLVEKFANPIVLKNADSPVDLVNDAAHAMVDPAAFARNPQIIDLASTPTEELLLIRGGLIDLIAEPTGEVGPGKIQIAHARVVDELKRRGVMHKNADTEKAVWSGAFINDLPDSSFLLIESGGKKDSEGKTVPRSLRHFPVKDQNGKIDLPHLRNAIARIPQAKIPGFDAAAKQRLQEKARRMLEDAQKSVKKEFGSHVRILKADTLTDTGGEKEERFVFGVVLVPEEPDSQGEIYSAEEVKKAAHSYMEKTNGVFKLMHAGQPIDGVRVLETYVTKVEEAHGGETLPVGTWVMAVRVIDDELWSMVKKGVFTGFSIGGTAIRESLH
jgi:hypothetical protein